MVLNNPDKEKNGEIIREIDKLTSYEKARIIGARALQLSMGAPILVKLSKKETESLEYDFLRIARMELEKGVIPLAVRRPMPERRTRYHVD